MKTGVIAGAFDVMHIGYIRALRECADNCEYLIVYLHEDPSIERAEKMKPILSVAERIETLSAIRYVDQIITYRLESDLLELLESRQKIDIRFLGDDYKNKSFTGDNLNIYVHFIDRSHNYSATKYKQMIADSINERANVV
tara:strand:- start:6829 stop:7251 length:423 start_codon:yes stop_codon:yes gene_type:complete